MYGRRGFGGGGGFGFGSPPPAARPSCSGKPGKTQAQCTLDGAQSGGDTGAALPPPAANLPPSQTGDASRPAEAFYATIPGPEVGYFHREKRVAYDGNLRERVVLVEYKVPSAQTLLISDVEFYAQMANVTMPSELLPVGERQLTGYVGFQLLVDDRVPLDLYSEIDSPIVANTMLGGSWISSLGKVIGGAGRQPFFVVRAREGQTVRLAYQTLSTPGIPVAHIGAAVRGYVVPTAVFSAKTGA